MLDTTATEDRPASEEGLIVLLHDCPDVQSKVSDAASRQMVECLLVDNLCDQWQGRAASIFAQLSRILGLPSVVEQLEQRGFDGPVIGLVEQDEPDSAGAGIGVWSVLRAPFSHVNLSEAISDALAEARRRYADRRLVDGFRRDARQLTREERDVMDAVCEGKLNKQIAREFGISVRTVEQRRRRVFAKMGVASAVPLASKLATVLTLERLRPHLRRDPGAK